MRLLYYHFVLQNTPYMIHFHILQLQATRVKHNKTKEKIANKDTSSYYIHQFTVT